MRLLAHVDWSGVRSATEELQRLGGQRLDGLAAQEPVAALGSSSRDLAGSWQGIAVAGDARLDNLDDLRARLEAGASASTAEIVARAYRAWGQTFADRLVGDFAFVLWDGTRRSALAARDPFGVRPLFYRRLGDRLWLASTVTALLGTFDGVPALDDERICEHLLWRYKSTEATFFRDIREVRAGFVLAATEGTTTSSRYWRPPAARSELARSAPDELWTEMRSLFLQSVRRRLPAARPAVVHVSGGLDSSSIAMAANQLVADGQAPSAAVVGASRIFPGLACDEAPFIDAVASAVQFRVERWDGRLSNPIDLLEPAVEAPAARVTSTAGEDGDVTLATSVGAEVILAGVGGDDLMMISGYVRDMVARHEWRSVARATVLAPGLDANARVGRLRRALGQFLPGKLRRLRTRWRTKVPTWLAPAWHEVARNVEVEEPPDVVLTSLVQRLTWSRLAAARSRQSINSLQVNGMRHGLEYRFPFLDRELVEFVLNLPPHCLPWSAPRNARIHREAFRPMLPPKIANRYSKAEFTPALANRVRRAGPLIENLLSRGDWVCQKYVARDAALRFYRAVTSSVSPTRGMDWWRVWNVATLEAWMRAVLGYPLVHKETSQ